MTMRFILWCLVACGAATGYGVVHFRDPMASQPASDPPARALPVPVVQIIPASSYRRRHEYTGLIVPRRASELGFVRGGKVVQLQVDEGDRVAAGDVIAELKADALRVERARIRAQADEALARLQMLEKGPREQTIRAAEARVASLQSRCDLRANNLARRRGLIHEQAISAEELDAAQFDLRAARADLAAAQEQLAELQAGSRQEEILAQRAVVEQLAAAFRAVEVDLEDSRLVAPFAGTISRRMIDEGAVVAAGAPVVRLVDDVQLEAHIGVSIDAVDGLTPGDDYDISGDTGAFGARLRAVLPEVNRSTRTRVAVFDLAPDQPERPAGGEMARVVIEQQVLCDGFWVPATALQRGQRGLWRVVAVVETGELGTQAEPRDVEVLFSDEDRAFVRGLISPGDRLVTAGLHRLVAGQPVVAVTEIAAATEVARRANPTPGIGERRNRSDEQPPAGYYQGIP